MKSAEHGFVSQTVREKEAAAKQTVKEKEAAAKQTE